MKKLYALIMIVVLLLSGCSASEAPEDISVKDVCCPYEITRKNNTLQITLQDGEKSNIDWNAETVPQEICTVSSEKKGKYRISGTQEGAAQVTFTALGEDETTEFVLTVVVHVDAQNKVTLTSYEHRQREDASVEADGLDYSCSVDVDGILTFSFINAEDRWSVRGGGDGVCTLTDKISTPSGCKFSARAASAGQGAIFLVGETTQRTILVTLQSDGNGKLEVISVQEQ